MIFFLLVSSFFAISKTEGAYVDPEISESASEGQNVNVIIKLKEQGTQKRLSAMSAEDKIEAKKISARASQEKFLSGMDEGGDFKIRHRYSLSGAVSASVSQSELETLAQNPDVEAIYYDRPIRAYLNESVPLVNASSFWNVNINNISVNGTGETVCIIDSGIDYNHPALGGGYGNNNPGSAFKVLGGYDFINSDEDPLDDYGHGTHVSGIVASINATYRGVAPGAKIISMKVLDNEGNGIFSDIDAAIEWCVNNASLFNISVITMSLGAGAESGYCDSIYDTTSELVGQAIENNIFVDAASGNDAYATLIGSPACLRNVTSVGAVYDTNVGGLDWTVCEDLTTTVDKIGCFSNAATILDMLAPGALIVSSNSTNRYVVEGGTSMAAPHVAGAALLLRNFKRNENSTILSPGQIELILKSTGKNITDSRNSLNYARINLSRALSYIDDTPRLSFSVIIANNTNITVNYSFVNLTVSEPIVNATLELDSQNRSMNGSSTYFYYNMTGLSDARHNFTIHLTDTTGNRIKSASYAFGVDGTKPNITDIANESLPTGFIVYFNTTEPTLAKIQYGTSPGVYTIEKNGTTYLTTSHNISLTGLSSDTNYRYIINVTDSFGNRNETTEYNYSTLTIDLENPAWSGNTTYPESGINYSASQTYEFNVTWTDDNRISLAWIEHNFNGSTANYSMTGNASTTYYYYYTGLAAGTYSWRIYANDTSGNINYTAPYTYTVNRAAPIINLTFNGTESNLTIGEDSVLNITANTTGDSYLLLIKNNSVISNRTKPSNITTFANLGVYNITAKYVQSQNYTASSKTYWVTVIDALPPNITVLSPRNYTYHNTTSLMLNLSLNENADCSFKIGEGPYNTTQASGSNNYRAITLSEGVYNISVNCTDTTGFSSSAFIRNITIDTTAPVLDIIYPSDSNIVTANTIEFNYTLDEAHVDKVWFNFNLNSTRNYTTPSDYSGGENLKSISFANAGKQVIVLYANDSAGNIAFANVTFIINNSFDVSGWASDMAQSMPNVTSVNVFNSSFRLLSGSIPVDQDMSLEINLSNIVLDIYNFTGRNAVWNLKFNVENNSSAFESLVNEVFGAEPLDYLNVKNISLFLNDSGDYYAKIKLPHNITYYNSKIYFCTDNALSDCELIPACSSVYSETTSGPCYNMTSANVFVYVPHLSSVFGINDTVAPIINITTPANNSLINSSYLNQIVFSANENSTCRYSINSGSFTTAGTSDSRYFTGNFSVYTNSTPLHNLTINCTDIYTNQRSSRVRFRINDTEGPSISVSEAAEIDEINLSFSFDEPSNWTVRLEGESALISSSFVTSGTAGFSNLDEDTRYDYNITACDQLGNCEIHSDYKTTDSESDSGDGGSGGGSGGGGSTGTGTAVRATEAWTNPKKGEYTMNIPTAQIALTQMIFTLANYITGTITFTVEKVGSLPSYIQDMSGTKYQYLKIDRGILKDSNLSSVVLKFRVAKTWISEKSINPLNISLYRYTTQWDKLNTRNTNSDGTYYYYEATSPGLSYFIIKGELLPPAITTTTVPETPPETPPVTGEVISDNDDDTNNGPARGSSGGLGFLIVSFLIVGAIIGGVAWFMTYKSTLSVKSDNDMKEIKSFVSKCKEEGMGFSKIREVLINAGWDEAIVDLVIHEVDIPTQEMDKITAYISTMRSKGTSDDIIKAKLKEVGWQEEIITEAFTVISKKAKK